MPSQALIITGMHRSGTSLVASILQAAGVDIGEKLLVPGPHNRKGYFEDASFYDLSRRILTACCDPCVAGFHEIGWMDRGEPDFSKASAFADEARDIIAQRLRGHPGIWGWKDPRTTLLLPFWDRLIPGARYVLVYRPPWGAVPSFFESQSEVFRANPDWPIRIWRLYNTHLVEFLRHHRDRCLLVAVDSVAADPRAFVRVAGKRFGLSFDDSAVTQCLETFLLRAPDHEETLPRVIASAFRGDVEILQALESLADLPGKYQMPPPPPDAEESRELLLTMGAEIHVERGQLKEARWEAQRLAKDIEAERSAHAETRSKLDAEAAVHAEKDRLLEGERSAHIETRVKLHAEVSAHAGTSAKLAAEAAAHAENTRLLEQERSAHAETQSKLDAERAAHADKARLLEGERSAHAETRSKLDAERAAHADKARLLEGERSAHAETRSKLDAERAAHADKARLLDQERAANAAVQEQLDAHRSYLVALRASRFWKLRALWFKLRRAVGLKTEINDL